MVGININATLKQKDQKPNSPQVCSNLQRNVTNKQIGNNIKTKGATTTSLNKVEELFADCQKCNIVLLSDLFLLFVCCSFLSVPHLASQTPSFSYSESRTIWGATNPNQIITNTDKSTAITPWTYDNHSTFIICESVT